MIATLDPRIVKVSIEINGQLKIYSDPIQLTANGTRYGNALQNECTVTLDNIDKDTQDYLLTETSPYNLNRTPKRVIVEAGRESYGTALIYTGNIVRAIVSQPPDITISLQCLTGNFYKNSIIGRSQPGTIPMSQISQAVANDLSVNLLYQATDKNITNYQYSGDALGQVGSLGQMGNYNAFIDNNTLIVKDAFIPLNNSLRVLSAETGMVGIPEFTEQGIKVKFLLDNQTTLGSSLEIQSKQYPAANGTYVIYKLGFQIANRDTPFYFIAEAARRR